MKLLATLYIISLILFGLFLFMAIVIENMVPESHRLKKWWRKNIIIILPESDDVPEKNEK